MKNLFTASRIALLAAALLLASCGGSDPADDPEPNPNPATGNGGGDENGNNGATPTPAPAPGNGQKGEDNTIVEWHSLGLSGFEQSDALPEGGYRLKTREPFINPAMRGKIFLGSLISDRAEGLGQLTNYPQYGFGKINITSASSKIIVRTDVASTVESTTALARDVIASLPQQNQSFFYASPIQYASYKHLHQLGMGNLGIALDEVVAGAPFTERDLGGRTGLICSYSQTLFSIIMDYPERIVGIPDADAAHMAYVSEMKFGRAAFLAVETESPVEISRVVVKRIMHGWELNDEQKAVAATLKAYYLHFDASGNLQKVVGGVELFDTFRTNIATEPIIPLTFMLQKYPNYSVDTLEYTIK